MSDPQTPPPGWYPNQAGALQWWDGTQWGPLAQQAPAPAAPVFAAPTPTTPAPATSQPHTEARVKPPVSLSVWVSFGLIAAIIIFAVVAAALANQVITHQMGARDSSMPPAMPLLTALQGLFYPAAIAALICAIVGTVKSQRKAPGIGAVVCSVLVLLLPAVLIVIGLLVWGGMGIYSQLSGGPVIG